jgi:hypothetical protein
VPVFARSFEFQRSWCDCAHGPGDEHAGVGVDQMRSEPVLVAVATI